MEYTGKNTYITKAYVARDFSGLTKNFYQTEHEKGNISNQTLELITSSTTLATDEIKGSLINS